MKISEKFYIAAETVLGRAESPARKVEGTEVTVMVSGLRPRVIDIEWALEEIQEGIDAQNADAPRQAKEFNREDNRYIVSDMVAEGLRYEDGFIYVECTWQDCYGGRRLYSSKPFECHKGREHYYLRPVKGGNFYF